MSEREVLEQLGQKYEMQFQVLDQADLAAVRDESDLNFCAWSYSVYVGSPIPRSGGTNWYFGDGFGVRLMDKNRFAPVAERYELPYETRFLVVYPDGVQIWYTVNEFSIGTKKPTQ